MKSKRRLFFDIETSFNIGWFWRPGKQLVRSTQIIHERAIICICWKWEGEDKVHHLTWDKKQCDKRMLKKFMKEVHKAHEIIAHNGDNFDLKWLRTRCLKHRIPTFPDYVSLDTLKLAKSTFNFNSNSLNYIAQFLEVGEKMETGGIKLWEDIIFHKCPDAMEKMVEYCETDVEVLENVYQELKNYSKHKYNYATTSGGEKFQCPECGSCNVGISKTTTTAAGTIRRHLKCRDCSRHYTVSNKSYMSLIDFKIKNGLK